VRPRGAVECSSPGSLSRTFRKQLWVSTLRPSLTSTKDPGWCTTILPKRLKQVSPGFNFHPVKKMLINLISAKPSINPLDKSLPFVSLERLPSNIVAISKQSPIKMAGLKELDDIILIAEMSPKKQKRETVIQFPSNRSPRRLLPLPDKSAPLNAEDDDSDDEVCIIAHYVK